MNTQMIIFALAISIASSIDCLATGLSYGYDKIKIPIKSMLIIIFGSSATLVATLALGDELAKYILPDTAKMIGAIILFTLGFYKLLSYVVMKLTTQNNLDKHIKFNLFSLQFIVQVCNQPKAADWDSNHIISGIEAIFLTLALSIDGMAIGLGAGMSNITPLFVGIIAVLLLLFTFASIKIGLKIGTILANKSPLNLGWLSGLLLIGLATYGVLY
ncbi:MAG: manganese efflux pump [Firmicutes bacterium]|nr:manganese efflux pump [Bacillota bacterium]MCL1953182.1 manganese efflux pump [Bacillota bacterium]